MLIYLITAIFQCNYVTSMQPHERKRYNLAFQPDNLFQNYISCIGIFFSDLFPENLKIFFTGGENFISKYNLYNSK